MPPAIQHCVSARGHIAGKRATRAPEAWPGTSRGAERLLDSMPCTDRKVFHKPGKKRKTAKPKDNLRFNCPYPGCDRSCAELWRLKVHFRAPPDSKGSGVERGHNAELEFCPRCLQRLETGKHHIGCRLGLAAPRQALKREERNQDARVRDRLRSRGQHGSLARGEDASMSPEASSQDEVGPDTKQEQPSTDSCFTGALMLGSQPPGAGPPLSGRPFSSLGGAIQLHRAASGHSDESQGTKAVVPSKGHTQVRSGLAVLPGLGDCEIDDEVMIPRSFVPSLYGGLGPVSPHHHRPPTLPTSTINLLNSPTLLAGPSFAGPNSPTAHPPWHNAMPAISFGSPL